MSSLASFGKERGTDGEALRPSLVDVAVVDEDVAPGHARIHARAGHLLHRLLHALMNDIDEAEASPCVPIFADATASRIGRQLVIQLTPPLALGPYRGSAEHWQ